MLNESNITKISPELNELKKLRVIITIEAEIDELEAECFKNNMTDEDLDGQADLVKDIMRMGYFSNHGVNPKINWKVVDDSPFNPWRLIGIK